MGGTRWGWTHGTKWTEFYGERSWRQGGTRVIRPRAYGNLPVETWRRELGRHFRQAGGALVPHGRNFLCAVILNSGGGAGSHEGGEATWNGGVVRLELPAIALEDLGWQESRAGSEPPHCSVCECHDWKRRRFFSSAGLRNSWNGC